MPGAVKSTERSVRGRVAAPGSTGWRARRLGRNIEVMPVNVWTVTVAAALTALATGLGAAPFAFLRNGMDRRWLGISNSIAAGFMLAASVGLLWQGFGLGVGEALPPAPRSAPSSSSASGG